MLSKTHGVAEESPETITVTTQRFFQAPITSPPSPLNTAFQIPTNDPAIAERVKELEAKRDVQRRGPAWLGGNAQNPSDSSAKVLVTATVA